jgi:hypothetical protein
VVPGGRARPQWHHVQYDPRKVQTVYEAAGAYEGLLRVARAWHARVMADEVVSHAFSRLSPRAQRAARRILGGGAWRADHIFGRIRATRPR